MFRLLPAICDPDRVGICDSVPLQRTGPSRLTGQLVVAGGLAIIRRRR